MGIGSDQDWLRSGSIAHQILLIEDDLDQAAACKELLESHGYRVQIAKDGGQAQAMFVMWKPDVVLLDVILPGESGFEVCERLKKTDDKVPVIFLTAIELEDARALSQRVGGAAFLTKPADPELLLQTIHDVAERNWERAHEEHHREEGRVRFSCRCGKKFKVSAAHRGKAMSCPECGEPVLVPRHD